jgi:excisionase family DNA binding protein
MTAATRSETLLHPLQAIEPDWRTRPYHSIRETARLLSCSHSRIYILLHTGELKAVRLGGKTLIDTQSIADFLTTATPWEPDRRRTAKAVASRPDVMRKRLQDLQEAKARAVSSKKRKIHISQ